MRPIKLTISAFGPYASKTEIPMDSLGKNGLYIIAGETGAGKTTLFDAIAYALYGEASGENRKVSMFRSKYAEADIPTYVELTFECKEKQYTVKRNPEYLRPAKRGDKLVTEKANAELICPDGSIISKEKAVTAAVCDIIGIDFSQFSGIAMIAQGEFQKMLLAPTEEREKIFRKIFRTQGYEQLQHKLSDEAKALNRERTLKKSGIQQDIQRIACNAEDPLFRDTQKAKAEELPIGDIIELLEKLIENDRQSKDRMRQKRKELNQKKAELTAVIARSETLAKAKEALEKDTAELVEKQREEQKAQALWQTEEAKDPLREEMRCKITLTESRMPRYDILEKLALRIAAEEKDLSENTEKVEKHTKLLNDLNKAVDSYKAELETLKNSETTLLTLEQQKKDLEQKQAEINNILQRLRDLEQQKQRKEKALAAYQAESLRCSKAEKQYRTLYQLFLDHQAGILAAELREDQPCPVCGSLHHPSPAVKAENAPTEEQLKVAEEQYTTAREKAEATSRMAGSENATLRAKTEELAETCKALPHDITPNNAATRLHTINEELQAQYTELCTSIKSAQQRCRRKTELETKILPQTETNIKKVTNILQELKNKQQTAESAIQSSKEQATALAEELTFPSKAEAKKHLAECKGKYHQWMELYREAKACHEKATEAVTALKSRIEANGALLKNESDIDITAEKEKLSALGEEEHDLHEAMENITSRLDTNRTTLQNITEKCGDLHSIEEKYRWVNALAETANGNLRGQGKEKIKLETYVQMTYFDRIIRRANIRLMTMTNGQYDLKRAKGAADNRSQTGLDLNVIDHYNGSERSVRTLSGGETFKASLALALGLSDEIRSSAGGIRIDTMFVDEGFGSLDEDSLQQAIKTLNDLTEGNRLVGIISHVADLKEKIEKQIIVTKTKTQGSKAEIIM